VRGKRVVEKWEKRGNMVVSQFPAKTKV